MKLANLQPGGRHLLALTGLTEVLQNFDTPEAAMASFDEASPLATARR